MGKGKGEDLIGQSQRSHRGVLGAEFKFLRRQCKLSFPFSFPSPTLPEELACRLHAGPRMRLKAKYRHRTLDGSLPAKVKES